MYILFVIRIRNISRGRGSKEGWWEGEEERRGAYELVVGSNMVRMDGCLGYGCCVRGVCGLLFWGEEGGW